MNIEKFEIMQSIQNALDNLTADEPRNNRVHDELIRLRNKIHNADRLESKFGPNAYMIKNLRTKKIETDAVSGISTLTERNI